MFKPFVCSRANSLLRQKNASSERAIESSERVKWFEIALRHSSGVLASSLAATIHSFGPTS
ncbi:hypothetical protein D3C85_1283970 [compost metagenome]